MQLELERERAAVRRFEHAAEQRAHRDRQQHEHHGADHVERRQRDDEHHRAPARHDAPRLVLQQIAAVDGNVGAGQDDHDEARDAEAVAAVEHRRGDRRRDDRDQPAGPWPSAAASAPCRAVSGTGPWRPRSPRRPRRTMNADRQCAGSTNSIPQRRTPSRMMAIDQNVLRLTEIRARDAALAEMRARGPPIGGRWPSSLICVA